MIAVFFSERKARKGEFQPFIGSDPDGTASSEDEGLVVDENPAKGRKPRDSKAPKLKLKLSCKL